MYTIFLSGTTGFLGTEIISELMQTTDDIVYGLTRAGSVPEAINTLTALWYGRPELTENLGRRILPVLGDITKENLGLSAADQNRLIHHTNYVIHTAAVIGIAENNMFLGTLNAGHPGGMLPLTSEEQTSFHNRRLPENLYIADATLLPESMGNPPIWTILALAKRIAKVCTAAIA